MYKDVIVHLQVTLRQAWYFVCLCASLKMNIVRNSANSSDPNPAEPKLFRSCILPFGRAPEAGETRANLKVSLGNVLAQELEQNVPGAVGVSIGREVAPRASKRFGSA